MSSGLQPLSGQVNWEFSDPSNHCCLRMCFIQSTFYFLKCLDLINFCWNCSSHTPCDRNSCSSAELCLWSLSEGRPGWFSMLFTGLALVAGRISSLWLWQLHSSEWDYRIFYCERHKGHSLHWFWTKYTMLSTGFFQCGHEGSRKIKTTELLCASLIHVSL